MQKTTVVSSRFRNSKTVGCLKRRFLIIVPITKMLQGIAIATKAIRNTAIVILMPKALSASGSG